MKTFSKPLTAAPVALVTGDRPEVELLLCCARTHIETAIASRIKTLLQQDLDWTDLVRTAFQHGVMPLLYRSLNTIYPEAVPQAALTQLRNLFQANAQRNLFLTGELLKLLKLLQANGISAIPFKGPILAASAYGNLVLRQFGDLDILVQERDVEKATDLFVSQGYRLPIQLTDVQEKPYFQFGQFLESAQYQGVYCFVKEEVFVELHWLFVQKRFRFPVDFQHLWERVDPVSLAGTTVPKFSPEDALVLTAINGAKGGFAQLKWICDVAELVRVYPGIDWAQVMKQSQLLGSQRMLLLGLLLAHELLETPLPKEVLLKIQAAPVAKRLAVQVREQLFKRGPTAFGEYVFTIKVLERLSHKFWYVLSIATTPTEKEWAFLPLPQPLSFLYYLIRPLRLLVELLPQPQKNVLEQGQ